MPEEQVQGAGGEWVGHVISHTHWDREWYQSFEQYRMRLVDLIDNLLVLLGRDPSYLFHLDGQAIVLEDYLEIKPQNGAILQEHIRQGRIKIGPWYVLPDEFLVSGESLIRNLLRGRRLCESFGGFMNIGYLPDMFGHISQMPMILRHFGIDNAIVWRGVGDTIPTAEFLWEGDDGSQVTAVSLVPGYWNAGSLPDDVAGAVKRLGAAIEAEKGRANCTHLLLMNGYDHLQAQPHISAVIAKANQDLPGIRVLHSDLPRYLQCVKDALACQRPALKRRKGELRDFSPKGEVFPGTLSARLYLKQKNANAERALERWVEPFSSLSLLYGGTYPAELIAQAWKYLLQNQPHDSICGCSVDRVHNQMLTRYESSGEIADEIRRRSLDYLSGTIRRDRVPPCDHLLVVFNPEDEFRTEVIEGSVRLNKTFAGLYRIGAREGEMYEDEVGDFVIKDLEGQVVPYQVLGERVTQEMEYQPYRMARRIDRKWYDIAFRAEQVPPLGFKVYGMARVGGNEKNVYRHAPLNGKAMRVTHASMENEYLHITIQDNGGLRVADKVTGRTYNDLNVFEDGGDAGDEYNYSPPKFDSVHMTGAGSLTSVARVASGPHVARFEVEHAWALPKALADDRSTRSAERTTCKVESLVTLKAGSPYLEIHTTIENVAKDHRIRALFPLPACVDTAYAEGVFTVNARRTQPAESRADETETNPNTHPQKCFVDAGDEAAGLAVFNVGLPEYEVKDQKVLALTLLRAVGWLARDDFQSRDTSIGTRRSLPAPGAQCIDRYEYDYAVMPHRGQWVEARVHKHAHQFNNRLHLHQKSVVELRDDGTLDPIYGFVKVEPAALNVSALKRADAHPHLILRIYNISNGPVDGAIRLDRNIGKVRRSNFAEEGFEEIAINDQTVNLRFGPHEVMTFLLETI